MRNLKFTYSGSPIEMIVRYGSHELMIQLLENGTYEIFCDGGGYGKRPKTLGAAITFAEKALKDIIKNND